MSDTVIARRSVDTHAARATLIRPADTTPYTAEDVMANADDTHLQFPTIAVANRYSGRIRALNIWDADPTTVPAIDLYLFTADIAEVGDNVAFAPSDAEGLTMIAHIVSTAFSALGAAQEFSQTILDIPFKAGSGPVFGVPVITGAYTPVSAEQFTFELIVERD